MEFRGDPALLKSLASFAGLSEETERYSIEIASNPELSWSLSSADLLEASSTVRITRRNSSYTRLSPSGYKRVFNYRRSYRLDAKQRAKKARLQVEIGQAGYFELLPPELCERIFMELDIVSLSQLGLTAKHMMSRLVDLILSRACLKKFLTLSNEDDSTTKKEANEKLFQSLGLLMKRVTCLMPTSRRLTLMTDLVHRVDNLIDHSSCMSAHCSEVGMLSYYGAMMHTFIAGWDSDECRKVMEIIDSNANIQEKLAQVRSSGYGNAHATEIRVRYHFLKLYIDSAHTLADRWLWMSRILKAQQTLELRAYLLLLVFLPLNQEGGIDWTYCTSTNFPENLHSLSTIGFALGNLYRLASVPRQGESLLTEGEVVDLFPHIIGIPGPWNVRCISILLSCTRFEVGPVLLHNMIQYDCSKAVSVLIELSFNRARNVANLDIVLSMLRAVANLSKNKVLPHQMIGFMWSVLYTRSQTHQIPNQELDEEATHAIAVMRALGQVSMDRAFEATK